MLTKDSTREEFEEVLKYVMLSTPPERIFMIYASPETIEAWNKALEEAFKNIKT